MNISRAELMRMRANKVNCKRDSYRDILKEIEQSADRGAYHIVRKLAYDEQILLSDNGFQLLLIDSDNEYITKWGD